MAHEAKAGPALDTIDVCDGTGAPKSGGAQDALKLEHPQALAVKFLYGSLTIQVVVNFYRNNSLSNIVSDIIMFSCTTVTTN